MRTDELHKFSDGTLNHVRTTPNNIATRIEMDYLPKRRRSKKDKQRARVVINIIDKKLKDRRLMRNLEKFIGERPYGGDLRVGISRYYTLDENYYPTFCDEMDLFVFIRHSDPTKVRIGERELVERKVKKLKMTEGRTVSLSPLVTTTSEDSGDNIDKLFDDVDHEHSVEKGDDVLEKTIAKDASESLLPNTSGKSLASLRGVVSKGSVIPSGVMEPLIAASVAPVSDVGPLDSVNGTNLRTCPPHVRSLVVADIAVFSGSKARDASKDLENIGDFASLGEANADATNISKLNKPYTSTDSFYASQSLDTETMHRIYVPRWKVTNDSILEDPYVCHDLTDRLAPPTLFAQLRAMDYDQLYFEFNVGVARQVCLGVEVRMRAEHTLEMKGKLEDKFVEQTVLLSERDAKIAHLKSLLSLKESEAAEAIRLHGQLTTVEAADEAKDSELKYLKEKNFFLEGERDVMSEKIVTLKSANAAKEAELASISSQVAELTSDLSGFQLSRDELNSKVASLESKRDCLVTQKNSLESAFELFREHMEALQDEQAKILGDRVAEFDAAAIGFAVNKGIQDGLKARIDHGQAGRDLSVIEAYDPSTKAKYIDAINALGAVDFFLFSKLESKKDSCIVDLMDSLWLDGILAEILGAENLQPSPKQLMLPIHRLEDDVVTWETSISSSLQVVNLRVQRFMEEVKETRLLLTDVITPLVEPLSFKSLTGEASTSAALITTLSTTFASSNVVLPTLVVNDQVLDAEPHNEDPPVVAFEKEELGTSPE
nr:hypothetical protein [Tanacetum cinerariifolium]